MTNTKRNIKMVGFDSVLFKGMEINDELTQLEQNEILDHIRALASQNTSTELAGEIKFVKNVSGRNLKISGWHLAEI